PLYDPFRLSRLETCLDQPLCAPFRAPPSPRVRRRRFNAPEDRRPVESNILESNIGSSSHERLELPCQDEQLFLQQLACIPLITHRLLECPDARLRRKRLVECQVLRLDCTLHCTQAIFGFVSDPARAGGGSEDHPDGNGCDGFWLHSNSHP